MLNSWGVIMLLAEIISVGTELLMGEIVDSNAAYLAQELKNRGVFIQWKTIVGDNLERIIEAITRASKRSNIIILGGGLGPTDDDLTREGIAAVLAETPVIDELYLEKLKAFFTARGRTYPESNNKQAWIIPSGEALENPVGTAPGWFVRIPNSSTVIVAMPGPPREMKKMWAEQVLPRLNLPSSGFYHRTFRTFAIGESHIAERLAALTQSANPSVATYARRDGVHVRVAASAATLEEAKILAQPIEQKVQAALEGHIYGYDDESLAKIVGELLVKRGETIATLESLTGGLLADELTNVSGSSRYVQGGAITYSNEAKIKLGVKPQTIAAHGAVSSETALEMAIAAKTQFGTTWGVSTTGVAGPDTSEGKPVGTLFVGIAGPNGAEAYALPTAGDRRTIKERAALNALGQLWRQLTEQVKA
jgi:nicotinamide-nucleotide amidase